MLVYKGELKERWSVSQAASSDPAALKDLSMDRTTASYKLRGLAAFFQESLLEELRTCPFSLNIDEATAKNNEKVLAILVSHFSPSANRIVINHLDAITLTKVSSEMLFEELDKLFVKHGLPWENLVSVLMDSCAVMRGSKHGLETLIRGRVPGLLDIDGDTCHHAHNAAKAFCKPFGGVAEALMSDLHTDFKWSADLKDKLFDLCQILGIKATTPERYVPHRWLSVLDVALDTIRLFDAYTLFYYSFLRLEDRKLYTEIVNDIMQKRLVSETGKKSVTEIQLYLRKKFPSFTKEGKDRKIRLVEKCFDLRIEILTVLHTYTSVLPSLKKYVLFFQQKEPLMHRLHDKQHELFNEFCKSFLTPECLQKMPHQLDIEDKNSHKSDKDMFVPVKAADLLKTKEGLSHKKTFTSKLKTAYIACALTLQSKMPVNNPVLKACAALDPTVRRTTTAQRYLKALLKKTSLIDPDKREEFEKEVDTYSTSIRIPTAAPEISIDAFWAQIDKTEFPVMTEVAKKLLSAFHGPAVEASFSTMGQILDSGTKRIDINTYAAFQTVRYSLTARRTSAVNFFSKKDPLRESVPKKLTEKMQKSWKANEDRKEENRYADVAKKVCLGAPVHKPAAKTAEKQKLLDEGQRDREKNTRKRSAGSTMSASSQKKQKTSVATDSAGTTSSAESLEQRTAGTAVEFECEAGGQETAVPDPPVSKKVQQKLSCFFKQK